MLIGFLVCFDAKPRSLIYGPQIWQHFHQRTLNADNFEQFLWGPVALTTWMPTDRENAHRGSVPGGRCRYSQRAVLCHLFLAWKVVMARSLVSPSTFAADSALAMPKSILAAAVRRISSVTWAYTFSVVAEET